MTNNDTYIHTIVGGVHKYPVDCLVSTIHYI